MSGPIHVDFSTAGSKTFEESCVDALHDLHQLFEFGTWMVTKVDAEDWIVLKVRDHDYGIEEGDVFVWMESLCARMVKEEGPVLVQKPNRQLELTKAEIGRNLPIQAYMGLPLRTPGGISIGALCAIDPMPISADWETLKPQVEQIAARLVDAYCSEDRPIAETVTSRPIVAQQEDEIRMMLEPHWISLLESYACSSTLPCVSHSVIHVKIDAGSRKQEKITAELRGIIGTSNHLTYQGNGIYSMLITNCDSQRLNQVVELILTALNALNVKNSTGYSVRDGNESLVDTSERAMGLVISQELKNRAA